MARLQYEAERAQLLALRSTIDPHFLFNTLNAIAEWCRVDGAIAERAVLELSSILRAVLSSTHEPFWPLNRELQLVRTVTDLHLLRDKDLFTLELKVPSELSDSVMVPPMCLMTLVENAIKHGPDKGHRGLLQIQVSVSSAPLDRARGDGGVEIVVENPGPYAGPREGSAGLPSLEKQLALSYSGAARFSIHASGSAEQPRTRAELSLPVERHS